MAWYRCGMNATYNAQTVSRSGAVCNYVANVGGVPLSRFIANITPIQEGSGDPSPINQRPITGWSAVNVARTGKNMFNPIVYSSFLQPDGKYRGQASDINAVKTYLGTYIGKQMTFSSYIDLTVSPSPTYIRCVANINGSLKRGNTITSGNAGYTSVTFTPQSANDYIVITYGSGGDSPFTFYDIQLELGSTPSTYQPYTGQTVTINLNGTYYLATLNVLTGLLTVLGLLTTYDKDTSWTRNTSGVFYANAPDGIDDLYISNMFECFLPKGSSNALADGQCRLNNTNRFINFKVTSCDTVDDFKAFLGDSTIQIIYTLATPQTYQLTPAQLTQLLGENNVWCDSGDSEVDFFKIIRT